MINKERIEEIRRMHEETKDYICSSAQIFELLGVIDAETRRSDIAEAHNNYLESQRNEWMKARKIANLTRDEWKARANEYEKALRSNCEKYCLYFIPNKDHPMFCAHLWSGCTPASNDKSRFVFDSERFTESEESK